MGMKTLGAIFQRLMDQILGPLQPQCAVVYIENITIFSKTMEQHLMDVEAVLEKLAKANLKIKFGQMLFCARQSARIGTYCQQGRCQNQFYLGGRDPAESPSNQHNQSPRIFWNGQFLQEVHS